MIPRIRRSPNSPYQQENSYESQIYADQSASNCSCCSRSAVGDADLAEDVLVMGLDRVLRYVERERYLFVRHSADDHPQHGLFGWCKFFFADVLAQDLRDV